MEKIAFCIPVTSNKTDWINIEESYLYNLTLKTIKEYHNYYITFYISVDKDDKIFDNEKEMNKLKDYNIKVFINDFEKGAVTHHWNYLYCKALDDKNDYYWLVGDDIKYPENDDWLRDCINRLKSTNNIGIAGCYNGNPKLPMTQFLVSSKHKDIFNYAYPPQIKNWFCDNWLNSVYHKKYIHYCDKHFLLNTGGEPRYEIKNASKLCEILIKKDRKRLMFYINSKK
tara:strand:- start:566 stop:1246 length:681 start_codon:yes stop_codon:yes gene_type:complete